ncbi:MAG: LacI family DNA-binding transcriptional regulator [Mycoplasmatales bacterium]
MATIKDVAKLAGVSISSVSKVINNYPTATEEIRTKVMKAVEELNYIPNQVAASLSSKSKQRIGLIITVNDQKQAIDEINMQYILGANEKALELGIDVVIIFSTALKDKTYNELVMYLRSQMLTGLIIYGLNKDELQLQQIIREHLFQTVVVDADFVNKTTGCVTVDHYNGQKDVLVEFYKREKFKSILYIAGKQNGYVTGERTRAVVEFSKTNKLQLQIEYGNFSEKTAYTIAKEFGKDFDVIVCASDLMAIGAQHAISELSLHTPIAGYDGITLMGYVAPNILTCHQNFHKVSQIALEKLIDTINNGTIPTITLVDYKIGNISYQDVTF